METLTFTALAIFLVLVHKLIEFVIMAFMAAGSVLLMISIGWGIYDAVMSRKEKRK